MLSYVKLMDEIVESDTEAAKWFTKIEALFGTPSVRSRSHAQSVNRNLVFHLIFVVRSQTCSESFVYYNVELCDIRSAEPMHASRKSNPTEIGPN